MNDETKADAPEWAQPVARFEREAVSQMASRTGTDRTYTPKHKELLSLLATYARPDGTQVEVGRRLMRDTIRCSGARLGEIIDDLIRWGVLVETAAALGPHPTIYSVRVPDAVKSGDSSGDSSGDESGDESVDESGDLRGRSGDESG
ncbi:MAG TPA: hypothetical protein RMF84_01310, partial [Polyangiaceae bacterium LLY-WYZ-14_1]|nr:hypothetical protein [Polyangiaceae bacterium LLY-WYZ-14_1]